MKKASAKTLAILALLAATSGRARAGATQAINPTVGGKLILANGYLEQNRADDALDVVDELLEARKLRPVDLGQIHRFRGYILVSKGKTEEAGKEFEQALATDALDESAKQGVLYSLAQIYTQAGKYDRARALIDDWFATATDPKPEAYFLKAMILVQQEDFKDAAEPVRIAIEKSPQPRESWYQLQAAIQFQLSDYAGVADTLRHLVALSPQTKRYWVQLATIENQLGNEDDALATMGVAQAGGMLDEDRDLRQRARFCFVHDLPDCCAKTLEEGISSGKVKPDAAAWQLLANCYIASRETDKAMEPLAKAGELSEDGKGYLMLGQLQLQKDAFAEARESLDKARTKAKPADRPSIELLIGIAELGTDRFDEAEKAFRAAADDEKVRPAAESYLKHLDQLRALRQLQGNSTTAGDEGRKPAKNG